MPETIDDRDWRLRLRDAEDKLRLILIEKEALEEALVREAKGHGLVYLLDQLGMRMRKIEDENRSHRAFREGDRAQIRALGDEIEQALNGTALEAASLEVNEKTAEIRHWVSWAGQALKYEMDMIFVLGYVVGILLREGCELPNEYVEFDNRRREGFYNMIPMPGNHHERERSQEGLAEVARGAEWSGVPDGGQVRRGEAGPVPESGEPAAVPGRGEAGEGGEAELHREAGPRPRQV